MKQTVSKARARLTRQRDREASKAAHGRKPVPRERILVAVLTALGLGVSAVVLTGLEHLLAGTVRPSALLPWASDGTLAIAGLAAALALLRIAEPDCLQRRSAMGLLALICLMSLVPARAILHFSPDLVPVAVAPFLLPFAIAPLLGTILISGPAGAAVGLWTSLVMALMADRSLAVLVMGLIATAVSAHAAAAVRTRSKALRIGMVAGACQMIVVFAVAAAAGAGLNLVGIVHQAGACMVSGFFSALAVLLVLPSFESLFGMTSNITLLEFSDLSHPLLQRLAMEAPGTYHHSLVVATLAQAAADEIGVNSLQARVCAYFHDIGKLTKPDFFTENLQHARNPHDDLPPSMSTLIITAHVKEGVSLAVFHKLPEVVVDVIREHHGTGVLSCFHYKACEQMEEENGGPGRGSASVPEDAFRYPGPKPATKESAIIALADCIEAASRSLEKITPTSIEELVEDLIRARILDGQLDRCPLTLAELSRVRASFVFTLSNMLHARLAYPRDENRDQ